MKRKFIALALCMLLVVNPCFAASTGVVTVSGGSIATGGLSGGYSQATESAAITLTMAMLHGLGISVKLSQDAINAGQSAYSFVKGKFYEWVGGTSAEELNDSQYEDLKSRFEVINGGSNIDPDGNIYFNATAVDLIRRFLKWLDVSDYIANNNSSSGSGNTATINGISTFYGNQFPSLEDDDLYCGTSINRDSNKPQIEPFNVLVYNYYRNSTRFGRLYVYISDSTTGRVNYYRKSNDLFYGALSVLNNQRNGYTYGYGGDYALSKHVEGESFINTMPESGSVNTVAVINDFLDGGDGELEDGSSTGSADGLNYDGDFDSDVLNNPDNNNLVVQPDLVPALQNENQGQQINIPVQDYLEALKQILNQATNPQAVPEPIPAQDLPTLTPVPVSVPADLPLEWPVELPSSPDATPDLPTDNTPVTDPSTPVNPVDALPELTFNLDEYFPFCIPFDIYHLLGKFSADPVTPVFDIGFTEPFSNTQVNFHVDLSPWNNVASAIRTAELGAFIVGLAVASRAIFTRG